MVLVVTNSARKLAPDVAAAYVLEWSARPDISARSVLVTIFGDSILPVTRSLWLAQLFQLTELFGFSHRLVRTSMYRLAAEGWLTNERVGRQSCYHLTELAARESSQAEARIYQATSADWSGRWSLVFLENSSLDAQEQDRISEHLLWHGFIRLGRGVFGSPTATPAEVRELCLPLHPSSHVPIASANFADLGELVDSGFFSSGFNTPEVESVYGEFVERYEPFCSGGVPEQPLGAFALRTMLVHDIRRIRLRFPDVPSQLLRSDWIGDRAERVARTLYPVLSAAAAPGLSEVLEIEYPAVLPKRFD